MSKLKIQLSQINSTIGDLEGNCRKIVSEFKKASEFGCDLVVFPEMALSGYLCQDLLQKEYFIDEIEKKIREILLLTKSHETAVLLGAPLYDLGRKNKKILRNSAILLEKGEVKQLIHKKTLPSYGVFDEQRYFENAGHISTFEFRDQTLAVLICEDQWDAKNLFLLGEQVFDLVISLNASPYSKNKHKLRQQVIGNFAQKLQKPLVYVNQIGGQDSLVFDGSSFVMNSVAEIVLQMQEFAEDSAIVEIEKTGEVKARPRHEDGVTSCEDGVTSCEEGVINYEEEVTSSEVSRSFLTSCQPVFTTCHPVFMTGSTDQKRRDYSACVLGLRDYIQKNGFKKVLLGMSGGVDSALVACLAVDALGSENVALYALPSRFNSETSMTDATKCAKNLKINLEVISIEMLFSAMMMTLDDISNLAKENLQSRIRGNILMTISNSSGALLLSTGNKSELACGYATLYGDMCGAFNPIKDLYKTEVYELAKWRNKNLIEISAFKEKNLIPQNILTKAPTAELRENQKDSDSLPEYEILDRILFQLIEEKKSVAEIIAAGFTEELVKKIANLFYASEYKRQQSCLGPKISEMAFDLERRYPITNKFVK